jgi:hypothetical protein
VTAIKQSIATAACGCGHAWKKHARQVNGAFACRHHGCGCRDVVLPQWKEEFPDFPDADMPPLVEGLEDISWHNDVCPSFSSEALGVYLFVDYANAARREFPEGPRFRLSEYVGEGEGPGNEIVETDDWDEVLAAIAGRRVASGTQPPAADMFSYFAQTLCRAPRERTLRNLPVASPCGEQCKAAVDAAKAFKDATDSSVHAEIIEAANHAIEVYWIG